MITISVSTLIKAFALIIPLLWIFIDWLHFEQRRKYQWGYWEETVYKILRSQVRGVKYHPDLPYKKEEMEIITELIKSDVLLGRVESDGGIYHYCITDDGRKTFDGMKFWLFQQQNRTNVLVIVITAILGLFFTK